MVFSRLPVVLKCSDNKADTILTCFVDAVRKYGLTSRPLWNETFPCAGQNLSWLYCALIPWLILVKTTSQTVIPSFFVRQFVRR